DLGELPAVDQRAPEDDMGREIFHDDQRLALVEMVDCGNGTLARPRLLAGQGVILEEGALQWQRPTLAHEAHIGQRLLDDGATLVALHDEDEVQITVADLTHVPAGRIGTYARPESLHVA